MLLVVLYKKWWMGSQKIYLGANRRKIEKIELHNGTILIYRIEFRGVQSVKSYHIPKTVIVTNSEGNRFQLDIERFWADAAVSPDLSGPRAGRSPDLGLHFIGSAAQQGPGGVGDEGSEHAAQGAGRGNHLPGLPERQGGSDGGDELRSAPY